MNPRSHPRSSFVHAGILVPTGAAASTAIHAADTPANLDAWFNQQSRIVSWQADVIQTRSLRSVSQPLTNSGRIWFQAPNSFRWELGSPARTVATRQGNQLLLLYPAFERAELYSLGPNSRGPWRDSLALLEAGFPRSRDQLLASFELLTTETNGPNLQVTLQPKATAARRWMPRVHVTLALQDLALVATELVFADGSQLRNTFANPTLNPSLDPSLFSTAVPKGYQLTQPSGP